MCTWSVLCFKVKVPPATATDHRPHKLVGITLALNYDKVESYIALDSCGSWV